MLRKLFKLLSAHKYIYGASVLIIAAIITGLLVAIPRNVQIKPTSSIKHIVVKSKAQPVIHPTPVNAYTTTAQASVPSQPTPIVIPPTTTKVDPFIAWIFKYDGGDSSDTSSHLSTDTEDIYGATMHCAVNFCPAGTQLCNTLQTDLVYAKSLPTIPNTEAESYWQNALSYFTQASAICSTTTSLPNNLNSDMSNGLQSLLSMGTVVDNYLLSHKSYGS